VKDWILTASYDVLLFWLTASIWACYLVISGTSYVALVVLTIDHYRERRIADVAPSGKQALAEIAYALPILFMHCAACALIVVATRAGWGVMYFDIAKYGWAYYAFTHLLLLYLHDAYYFFEHLLMHRPFFYRRFHYIHHAFKNPSPFAGYAFHPLEGVLKAAFIPLVALVVPLHYSVIGIRTRT
jgi:lathosterol oxidase